MGYKERAGADPQGFFTEGAVPEMPGGGLNARTAGAGISPDRPGPYAVNPQWNGKRFTQGNYMLLVGKTFIPTADVVVDVEAADDKKPGAGIPGRRQSGNHGRGIGAARQGREKYRTGIPCFAGAKTPVTVKGGKQPILETGPETFRLNPRHWFPVFSLTALHPEGTAESLRGS
jgi:hypothetical protein